MSDVGRCRRLAAVVLATGLFAGAVHALPSFAEVRAAHRPSDVTLTDRNGVPIQTVRVDKAVRRLAWVPLEQVSPALLQAIVLSEDRRFWEHGGVDWSAIATSAWANAWNRRTRGASTLTMQLAGLLDDDLARPAGGRSLPQKVAQAVSAAQLEARWTKSQILEAYLNRVGFRGEVVGIDALALTLFGKRPSGLDAREGAIAAALLRGPNAAAATVAERACGVLRLERLPCDGVRSLTATALVRRGGMPLGEQLAPHFARRRLLDDASAQRTTTLDAGLQRVALRALRDQLSELSGRDVEDGAVVVLDNATGEVRAWVGSSGDLSASREVDGVVARRQPGSTLKPFLYALAFERRLITPATLLDDAAAQVATAGGLYLPQNYDHAFKGWVSARTALGASLNVPAVRVATLVGVDAFAERLNALGLDLAHPGGWYGQSLALGSAEVTLLALTNAYRAFANGGIYAPVAGIVDRPARPRRIADPAAVWLAADILADNGARVRTFGLDNRLATHGWAAVKTGTSKDLRDNWCVGWTDRHTIGVWVGNASGAPMHGVSGVSGAAPVWRTLVDHLTAGRPSRAPAAPAGVVTATVAFEPAREPPRTEHFLAGTEARRQRGTLESRGEDARFGIANPRDGTVYALDPDIPPAAQKIAFDGAEGTWRLDGRRLGRGPRLDWAPWPGRHRLELVDAGGRILAEVRFEVRGAGVASGAAADGQRAKTRSSSTSIAMPQRL